MTPNLLDRLPAELLLKIYGSLDLDDQVRFSGAARRLRETAIHQWHLFRTMSVAIRDEVASTSALMVAGRYGHLVRELRLIVGPPPCHDSGCGCGEAWDDDEEMDLDDSDVDDSDVDEPTLPDSALSLIRIGSPQDRTLFPSLEKLVIQFPDTTAFGPHHTTLYFDAPDRERLRRLSLANDYMVDLVLGTLADPDYPTPYIKALSILHLPPIVSLQIGTHELNLVLSRVESFELSVFGEKAEGGYETSNGQSDYYDFFGHFPSGIFDQLSSVKSLKFRASHHAPLGFQEIDYYGRPYGVALPDALSRQVFHMSFLEELELSNVVVGPQLEALFYCYSMAPRKKPLSLRLVNVCANAATNYTWARFFNRLVELRVAIHRFEMSARGGSIEAIKHEGDLVSAMANISADAKALLASNPAFRVFPYGCGEKGVVSDSNATTARNLIKGEDQAAYGRFMATVQVAAAAAASQ
ncbi:hypothetical protein RB595_008886 [Gaeumannomyces hyphopodioides]